MTGTSPSSSLLARIRQGKLGGVILFADNIASQRQLKALTGQLQGAAAGGGNPPLLILVDQEGGLVKRLPEAPPFQSPRSMGERGDGAAARRAGLATGRLLRRLGINVNLAPVLDVPDSGRSFLASRAFGQDPRLVAALGVAFARGLQQAGIAATGKHFPGLGTAPGNTDTAAVRVSTPRGELMRRLLPFRRAVEEGIRLVMVSNAAYPALDPSGSPAVLSPAIVGGLLRRRLGFGGVVITDTMSAPGLAGRPDAPLAALRAGVDLLLYSDGETASVEAYRTLLRAARRGSLDFSQLAASRARILELKRWLSSPRRAVRASS
jgi:beta-N-acetylhexosaminidase